MDRTIKILRSETAFWVAQNSVGVIVPLLFAIIPALRFPMACIASVFFAINSQTLSGDTTIGGRIMAGCKFMGATMTGGLVGFAVISLSWLARGSARSLFEIAADMELPNITNYFDGQGDLSGAIEFLYEDIQVIREADMMRIPTVFWVLLIVLFGILTIPWAWIRSTATNPLKISSSVISLALTCSVAVFGIVIPVTGQHALWTLVFGGFLKAACIAMLGVILGGTLIYVRSAHDELRKCYAGVIKDAGNNISHVTACLQESMHVAASAKSSLRNIGLKPLSHIIEYDKTMRKGSIKCYLEMLQDLQLTNGLLSSCKTEPPIPGFASQWGANVDLYSLVGEYIECLVSQIGSIELIFMSIKGNADRDGDRKNQGSWSTAADIPIGLRIVQSASYVSAGVASVLQASSDALSHMPVFKRCSGNTISWRPKRKEFWLDFYREISNILHDKEMRMYLGKSGLSGTKEILDNSEGSSTSFCLDGSSLVLVTALESLLDYSIQLDQTIAKALDIDDFEQFEAKDIHSMLRSGLDTGKFFIFAILWNINFPFYFRKDFSKKKDL